jgi:1-acyl-sn-glycerol-3-phosphate acyltransferase
MENNSYRHSRRPKMGSKKKTRRRSIPPEMIEEIIEGTLGIDEEAQAATFEKVYRYLKFFASPTIIGAENIPDEPCLFVGNHSTMALDVAILIPALLKASGRLVRGMSDEAMYLNPRLRKFLVSNGAVMGNQKIGSALLDAGKDALVFPGGAYEANKDLADRYKVMWKDRTGFVRLAARHGAPIVPVGIVGPDEWFGRYMDRDDMRDSRFAALLKKAGVTEEFMESDLVPPIPKGLFGMPLVPKPQPVYISIGEPVETKSYQGKTIGVKAQGKLRDASKKILEQCIADMLLRQAQERESAGLVRKILTI